MKQLLICLVLQCAIQAMTQEQHEEEAENSLVLTRQPSEVFPEFLEQNEHRYHINRVSAIELSATGLLTKGQIDAFMNHKQQFGPFISLMELQSIMGWDASIVRKIIPLLYYRPESQFVPEMKQRFKEGTHRILFRTGGSTRWRSEKDGYVGNSSRYLFNYRFQFEKLFRMGFTVEKDAGEVRRMDHRSGYLVIGKKGWIQQAILGDFQVNMGQGLIHWQGYAIGKGAGILSSFRQDQLFIPHTGNDENRFHRGVAISIKKGKMEGSLFVSRLNTDARIDTLGTDSIPIITSLLSSGLHRSAGELRTRKSLSKSAMGGRIRFTHSLGSLGINALVHSFSIPLIKEQKIYNQHAVAGKIWWNASIDHQWMTPWGLLFGEIAVDRQGDWSVIANWIKSIDPKLDLTIGYRKMSPEYSALETNCFSDNGTAGNEEGIYFSTVFQPHKSHYWELFVDRFRKPWPSFSVDGIEYGGAWGVKYSWRPNKKTSMQLRLQQQGSQFRFRMHVIMQPGEQVELRIRNEVTFLKSEKSREVGMLSYAEWIGKDLIKGLTLSMRLTFFETSSYATRIYAYERDVQGQFMVPAHYGKGTRAYILAAYGLRNGIKLQGKWSLHRYREWRIQVICPLS